MLRPRRLRDDWGQVAHISLHGMRGKDLRPAMVDRRFWERGSKDLNYRRGIVNSIVLFGGPFNPFSEPARGLSVTGILNYLPLLAFLLMARCASIYVFQTMYIFHLCKGAPLLIYTFSFPWKKQA